MSTHPYFIAKARLALANVGADPELSEPLAQWAEDHRNDETAQGVIVGQDGTLLAETWHDHTGGATYVRRADSKRWGLVADELGLAMGTIERAAGMPVVHIKRSVVCFGPGVRNGV